MIHTSNYEFSNNRFYNNYLLYYYYFKISSFQSNVERKCQSRQSKVLSRFVLYWVFEFHPRIKSNIVYFIKIQWSKLAFVMKIAFKCSCHELRDLLSYYKKIQRICPSSWIIWIESYEFISSHLLYSGCLACELGLN